MNIFDLFNSNDTNSIKLGIKVIKTLGYQQEFLLYFKITIDTYSQILNTILSKKTMSYTDKITLEFFLTKLDIKTLFVTEIWWILKEYPELVVLLKTHYLPNGFLTSLLILQPQLIEYYDLSDLEGDDVTKILIEQPQLTSYFYK